VRLRRVWYHPCQMRSSVKKKARHAKRRRSPFVRALGEERPTAVEREAIAQGRRAFERGDVTPLKHIKRPLIEGRPSVLAAEPVVKGTRIPVRLIADLVRQGMPRAKLRSGFDLTREEIEAAILFDRVTPRRVRRPVRRIQVKNYLTERARRASIPRALRILKRAGVGKPPMNGDELRPSRKRR